MIELIYFGMMPLIVFVAAVAYHLNLISLDTSDQNDLFGLGLLLVVWPVILLVAVFCGIIYVALVTINWLAIRTANILKKVINK